MVLKPLVPLKGGLGCPPKIVSFNVGQDPCTPPEPRIWVRSSLKAGSGWEGLVLIVIAMQGKPNLVEILTAVELTRTAARPLDCSENHREQDANDADYY